MRYRARPVEVDASVIVSVSDYDASDYLTLTLDDNTTVKIDASMYARYVPKSGDFYVIQSDGYVYLNPRDVFLRKYEPIDIVREKLYAV